MKKDSTPQSQSHKRPATKGASDDVRTAFAEGEPSITKPTKSTDPKPKGSNGGNVDESGRAGAKP